MDAVVHHRRTARTGIVHAALPRGLRLVGASRVAAVVEFLFLVVTVGHVHNMFLAWGPNPDQRASKTSVNRNYLKVHVGLRDGRALRFQKSFGNVSSLAAQQ